MYIAVVGSGVVHIIQCSRCQVCYAGQTCRYIKTRISEHSYANQVKEPFQNCDVQVAIECVDILASSSLGENRLLTLEGLHNRQSKHQR